MGLVVEFFFPLVCWLVVVFWFAFFPSLAVWHLALVFHTIVHSLSPHISGMGKGIDWQEGKTPGLR